MPDSIKNSNASINSVSVILSSAQNPATPLIHVGIVSVCEYTRLTPEIITTDKRMPIITFNEKMEF